MWSLVQFLWGTALNKMRERGVPLPPPKQGGQIKIYRPEDFRKRTDDKPVPNPRNQTPEREKDNGS